MTETNEFRHHEFLVNGLVGNHLDLYRTNSIFKLTVDNLANLLPLWIDAITVEAVKQEKQVRQALLAATNITPDKTELLKKLGLQNLVNMDEEAKFSLDPNVVNKDDK